MVGTLVYKRKVINSKDGYGRLTVPMEILHYLGVPLGGEVEMLVDPKSPVPSLVVRRALEEA